MADAIITLVGTDNGGGAAGSSGTLTGYSNLLINRIVSLTGSLVGATASTYTWALAYQPPGSVSDAIVAGSSSDLASITPRKEDSYRITLRIVDTLSAVYSASVVLGVRRVKNPTIRVPAGGETTELSSSNGWAADAAAVFDLVDTTKSDPGVIVCTVSDSTVTARSTIVYFNTFGGIKTGLPGEEFVPSVSKAASSGQNTIHQPLGVVEGMVTGSFPASSGSMIYVRRFGIHSSSFSVGGTIGDPVYVDSLGRFNGVPGADGTYVRRVGTLLSQNRVFFDDAPPPATMQLIASGSAPVSFIVAGANVGVASSSNGQVVISSITGSSGWIDGVNKMKTTGSISIDASSRYADAIGSDVFFFVSGSSGSVSGSNRHVSVFGGDIVISGSFISIAPGTTLPTIQQSTLSTNSSVGQTFVIQAQNASGSASTGGALVLNTGTGTSAHGNFKVKIGPNDFVVLAANELSTRIGYSCAASQTYSVSIGAYNNSSGVASVTLGELNTASNTNATAIGFSSTASGLYSTALGVTCYALGKQSTAIGVNCAANLAGELGHGSGHSGAQGLHAWDLDRTLSATTGSLLLIDASEITISHQTLLCVTAKVSACTSSGMTKAGAEMLEFLVATAAGNSFISGSVSSRAIGQNLASQGWGVAVSIASSNTLRFVCDAGTDTVRFFARVEASQVTP